ncbi:hypothetical protein HKL94_02800 [Candidatus Parcubacteria bacterium]|nr:hypothetical protein [Candidatus Parcubacteria bacterium]
MTRPAFLLFLFLFLFGAISGIPQSAFADTTSVTTIQSLQAEIATDEQQIAVLGTKKVTLQSTINTLTLRQKELATQIRLTQAQIISENQKIGDLTVSIGDTETNIAASQDAIAKALRDVAEGETVPVIAQLISSNSLSDAWQTADTVLQFNRALGNNITDLRNAQVMLSTNRNQVTAEKTKLVSLQADLSAQNKSVAQNKAQQQQLLAQTKNSEANFQKLLAAAKAELTSFSAFTTAAGGSKLLANQTVCDGWGCYYNQRDALWGNLPLNGTRYRLASDGCLVTSMAMVLTHYGYRNVTPVTINSNPDNFLAGVTGDMLFTTYVDGIKATRIASIIDRTLATGNPVIVGLHAYGGTHFVVLVSGRRGSYVMRDPYVANGNDISFSSHYRLGSIYAINKVVISG